METVTEAPNAAVAALRLKLHLTAAADATAKPAALPSSHRRAVHQHRHRLLRAAGRPERLSHRCPLPPSSSASCAAFPRRLATAKATEAAKAAAPALSLKHHGAARRRRGMQEAASLPALQDLKPGG